MDGFRRHAPGPSNGNHRAFLPPTFISYAMLPFAGAMETSVRAARSAKRTISTPSASSRLAE